MAASFPARSAGDERPRSWLLRGGADRRKPVV